MMETNPHARLETFCDGVFAIAITLLILEIKVPPIDSVNTKKELWLAFAHELPSLLAFLLSFIFILIAWVNHANVFKLLGKSSQQFIYANGLLMLSVVLVPFVTGAVAEFLNSPDPGLAQPAITLYRAVILLNNISWMLLQYTSLYAETLAKPNVDIEKIKKLAGFTRMGFVLYTFVFALSFWFPITAFIIMALSFLLW